MARYWIGRLLLVALLVGSVFGLISLWQTISGAKEAPCVPFAQTEVPDENDGNWSAPETTKISADAISPWQEINYYEHKKLKGLKLGVYSYFGQVAFKAWACNNSKRPAKSKHPKDREDHMVSVFKDVKWYSAYAQKAETTLKRDVSGNVLAVVITLLDKDGKVVVQRYMERLN